MPPKRKRKNPTAANKAAKKPKADEEQPPEEAPETEVDSTTGPVLYVEHCRSCTTYKRRAVDLHSEIIEHLPNIKLILNTSGPPRRGAFELSLAKEPTDDVDARKLIWTGIKKGPPRRLKFPSSDVILDAIKKELD